MTKAAIDISEFIRAEEQVADISRRLIPGYDPWKDADDYEFDAEAATDAVNFFPVWLRFIEGARAGTPFYLEDWQAATVGNVYGWKHKKTGLRRYAEVFEYLPRKNGKSVKLAGVVDYEAIFFGEPGAQLYSAAAEKEQASLVYRFAVGMILADPELSQMVKHYKTFKSFEIPATNTIFKSLSSDASTKHGLGPQFVGVDELHAHRNRDLVDVLKTGMSAREQPLMWTITTADFDRESICNEKHDYACKVRDGVIVDHEFLPVIYEALREENWTSEEVWKRVNPNLGVSKSLRYMRAECKKAQEIPAYENTFKRLELNMKTQQDVRWLTLESWDRCGLDGDENPMGWRLHEIERLKGSECYIGLDLATKRDLTAAVLLFPEGGDVWTVLPWFWCPKADIERRSRRDKVPYDAWVRDGWIEPIDGDVFDQSVVRAAINEIFATRFQIKAIGFDPWNGEWVNQQVGNEDGLMVVRVFQNLKSLNEASKAFEARVVAGQLRHGMNPVLRWMAGNVAVYQDGNGNIRPDKKKSTERIDGISATITTIAVELAGIEPETSVYEDRGVLVI